MAIARIPFITDRKKKKLKKIKNPSRMPMKLSSWFGSKKEEEKPTVGKKVGQETLDAIKRRKKAMDELMG